MPGQSAGTTPDVDLSTNQKSGTPTGELNDYHVFWLVTVLGRIRWKSLFSKGERVLGRGIAAVWVIILVIGFAEEFVHTFNIVRLSDLTIILGMLDAVIVSLNAVLLTRSLRPDGWVERKSKEATAEFDRVLGIKSTLLRVLALVAQWAEWSPEENGTLHETERELAEASVLSSALDDLTVRLDNIPAPGLLQQAACLLSILTGVLGFPLILAIYGSVAQMMGIVVLAIQASTLPLQLVYALKKASLFKELKEIEKKTHRLPQPSKLGELEEKARAARAMRLIEEDFQSSVYASLAALKPQQLRIIQSSQSLADLLKTHPEKARMIQKAIREQLRQ